MDEEMVKSHYFEQARTMAEIASLISAVRTEGYVVIPNVLSSEEVKHYQLLIDGVKQNKLAMKHENVVNFHGSPENVSVVHNLHSKHIDFWKLIAHPIVLSIADILLKEGSFGNEEPYQLASSQSRSISGHEPRQQLHIDSRLPGTKHALALVAGWSLTEFTERNGATRFVPGSHREESFPEMGLVHPKEVIAECPAGSLMIFNAGLWHGASEKIDSSERAGLFFNYCRWFMRPAFKINRCMPDSVREQLSERMIELSGAYYEEPIDENEREVRKSSVPQW